MPAVQALGRRRTMRGDPGLLPAYYRAFSLPCFSNLAQLRRHKAPTGLQPPGLEAAEELRRYMYAFGVGCPEVRQVASQRVASPAARPPRESAELRLSTLVAVVAHTYLLGFLMAT